jgi:hypothetical protein
MAAGGTGYTRYGNALPKITDPITGAATNNYSYWNWGAAKGDGDKFIFDQWGVNSSFGNGGLWQFDAANFNPANPSASFSFIKHIGVTNLGCAYDQAANTMFFTRQVTDPTNPNPQVSTPQGDAGHLMGLNLSTLLLTDYGLIEDQLGRRPWRVESMSAANGKVFFSGDWYLLSDGANPASATEYGTYRYQPTPHTYLPYTRGQIFAVALVPEPTSALSVLAGLLALLCRRNRA